MPGIPGSIEGIIRKIPHVMLQQFEEEELQDFGSRRWEAGVSSGIRKKPDLKLSHASVMHAILFCHELYG